MEENRLISAEPLWCIKESTQERPADLSSAVPSLRKIPCSTSAWESSDTRSHIAQSSPADRQFSYWPMGLRLSLVSPSSSATRSASGDPTAWPVAAFLRDLGGLFRKNLFCDDRASWDKRLNFLDWLIWHDLAMGRKHRERNHMKKVCMLLRVNRDAGVHPVSVSVAFSRAVNIKAENNGKVIAAEQDNAVSRYCRSRKPLS